MGQRLTEVFSKSKDLEILLVLSPDMVDFANGLIADCLRTAGFTNMEPALQKERGCCSMALGPHSGLADMDRRTDEYELSYRVAFVSTDFFLIRVREILWAYFRANEHMQYEESDSHVMTQISKRAIRTNVQEEMEAFVIWAGRQPYAKINAHYLVEDIVGHMSELSFDDEDDDDE